MPTLPTNVSVTYTGSDGAGMQALITDQGSRNFAVEMGDGWGEFRDPRLYKVVGPPTAYDAIVGLSVAGYGLNGTHPYIAGISGGAMKAVEKIKGKGPGGTQQAGWIIEVTYARPPMGIWGDTNVLGRPVVINFGFSFLRLPTEIDSQGYVISNSAGDVFDPPQSIDVAILRVRCAKWLSAYTIANARNLVGKVNASSVTLSNSIGTAAARTLKCLNYAPANDIIPSAPYVFTIFEFEQRLDTYDRKLIDKGFTAWYNDTASANKKGKLAGKMNLQPISQPVLLEGDGTPLLPDHLAVTDTKFSAFAAPATSKLPTYLTAVRGTDTAGGFYLPYRVEKEADFSTFASIGL